MGREYFISDTHFNHTNIIKYCARPFESVKSMDAYIIEKWNSVVDKKDIVYHLGDFAFNLSKDEVIKLVSKLNGKIVLVMGNHDRKGKAWFKSVGFSEVYRKSMTLGNMVLTHKPLEEGDIPEGIVNIHGHIHNNNKVVFNSEKYINVSCEVINYTPVLKKDILRGRS